MFLLHPLSLTYSNIPGRKKQTNTRRRIMWRRAIQLRGVGGSAMVKPVVVILTERDREKERERVRPACEGVWYTDIEREWDILEGVWWCVRVCDWWCDILYIIYKACDILIVSYIYDTYISLSIYISLSLHRSLLHQKLSKFTKKTRTSNTP